MENQKEDVQNEKKQTHLSYLEAASKLTMEELESLSFTKIVKDNGEDQEFIGLGILGRDGYLLEYHELKKIYSGLNYFIRKANPELIKKMNEQQYQAEKMEREKDELLELVSKNIVDKEEWEEENFKERGFFATLKRFLNK